MRRVIVTPAGREKYLEILFLYLKRDYELGHFKEWHLWMNTVNQEDIDYMEGLAKEYDWVRVIPLSIPHAGSLSIHSFYRMPDYCDEDSVYLRLDDDICFVDNLAIERMFQFRLNNPQYFLTFGNIVNNAICGHIHQRMRLVPKDEGINGYSCMDFTGWKNPLFAELVHETFFKNYFFRDVYHFRPWELFHYERFSINCISWLGKDFAKFKGEVYYDEEAWLSETKPIMEERPCCICGNALFVHFAFYTQREYLEEHTDLLQRYKGHAEGML